MKRSTCFLCGCKLQPISSGRFQAHPEADDCLVRVTDEYGVACELPQELDVTGDAPEYFIDIETAFPPIDQVLGEIFADVDLPRLGGASSGKGWSSFLTFQRCWYLWKRKYLDPREQAMLMPVEDKASLAIGSLIHTWLAIFYMRMIKPAYPLTPNDVLQKLRVKGANPKHVDEAWRVFFAYSVLYQDEEIQPLAIEHDLRDPRTGESCRYDLIAFYPHTTPQGYPPGTYVVEHKSSGRFDRPTIEGWGNDGEVLGQVMLWERLGLANRFGPLQGVIINLLGKQKEPQFLRILVAPTSFQMDQHRRDLRSHESLIQLARANDLWPRSRANCINRWGMCDQWEHCLSKEPG